MNWNKNFFSCRKPSHYIYVHDTMYLLENMGMAGVTLGGSHPRGSLHSLRRGSFDVKSIGSDIGSKVVFILSLLLSTYCILFFHMLSIDSIAQRRSSLQKLNNLPLEAPITKVMTLLTNAMSEIAGMNPETAMQIDKVTIVVY